LPAGTTIDGNSQTVFSGDTNAAGPEIVINGSQAGALAAGLVLSEPNCAVQNLVVSGFSQKGIVISGAGAAGNRITGCYIGTDAAGSSALPNSVSGIEINAGAHDNTLGGTTIADRNIISGNSGCGIKLTGAGCNANLIIGNFIGLTSDGSSDLPNTLEGIVIQNDAQDNTVGGTATGAGNRIWANAREGIAISGNALRNKLRQNSIYGNGGRGIVLYDNANSQQAFPILNSAVLSASDQNLSGVDIAGSLKSLPNTAFGINFFANAVADPSGFGQGQTFIGTTTVTTDSKGSRNFSVKLPAAVPAGHFLTAKATSPDGNTSAHSAVRIVTASDSDGDGMPNKYESNRKFNQSSAADAGWDHDGDGMTNLAEFHAGTDPRSAASRLVPSSVSVDAGLPRITFQSAAGKTYRVEFTDTIGDGGWKILVPGLFTVQSTLTEISDPRGTANRRYYRIALEPSS
jgi:hypothetical protein